MDAHNIRPALELVLVDPAAVVQRPEPRLRVDEARVFLSFKIGNRRFERHCLPVCEPVVLKDEDVD